jgi:hypothetical protein
MESSMNIDNNTPAGFTELDTRFLLHQEGIRDRIAGLLADALHGCPEEERTLHVENAFMVYESLAAMHGILWSIVGLVDCPRPNA